MKDFKPGVLIERSVSIRIVKYLIYKFYRSNIKKQQYVKNKIIYRKTRFSFKTPFSYDDGEFICIDQLISLIGGESVLVMRHYSIDGLENPVFCAALEDLMEVFEGIDQFFNYEYSCIFDKKYRWCVFITDSTSDFNGMTVPIMKLVSPLLKV